jgi:nucleoside phosphorylase
MVRASPRPPHRRLLAAVRLLASDELLGERPWEGLARRADRLQRAKRPDDSSDVLHESHAPHASVAHPLDPRRRPGEPRVFLGPIASANVLLKDPVWRDRLRDRWGVRAVEMEGAGVADATWNDSIGFLVVRGICDYCDAYKNDDWHVYASVVAAAYMRAVLERMACEAGVPER